MNNLISSVKAFWADEQGVTAIEYGLIATLVGVAMVTAATLLGGKISDAFKYVANQLIVPTS